MPVFSKDTATFFGLLMLLALTEVGNDTGGGARAVELDDDDGFVLVSATGCVDTCLNPGRFFHERGEEEALMLLRHDEGDRVLIVGEAERTLGDMVIREGDGERADPNVKGVFCFAVLRGVVLNLSAMLATLTLSGVSIMERGNPFESED